MTPDEKTTLVFKMRKWTIDGQKFVETDFAKKLCDEKTQTEAVDGPYIKKGNLN